MAEMHSPIRQEMEMAKPIHIQRLEASLDVVPFLSYIEQVMGRSLSDTEDESDSDAPGSGDNMLYGDKLVHGVVTTKEERRSDKLRLYNFSNVGVERRWLQEVLISDSETSSSDSDLTISEEYLQEMLKMHLRNKRVQARYYMKPNNLQYQYYGTGLLSNYDKFLEHQKSIVGVKKQRIKKEKKKEKKPPKPPKKQHKMKIKTEPMDDMDFGGQGIDWDEKILTLKEEPEDYEDIKPSAALLGMSSKAVAKARKKALMAKTPEVLAARRRKVWQLMSKKELGKVQRAKANNHKEYLTTCKRISSVCMKIGRQKAMQSQKNMKEIVWRAKRLTREMQSYWKRYDRVERETRRRMEREAEEQRKMDVEMIEAKRQQRKLNFLITQTELYAHFMSRKLGKGTTEEQLRILSQLDEEKNPRLSAIDHYDSEFMKEKAKRNAYEAFDTDRARTEQFNRQVMQAPMSPPVKPVLEDQPQPDIFRGNLKGYQIKGMTWLANLYNQGISGILADEMGLGKTVQSIAFLCHVAERYGVWGPFLIISPASTLHNWQQEIAKFAPDFNVVPYWGSPNERKILRQFWDQKDLHTREASFHVVVTSYQLVTADNRFFQKIKWQYMILDEAQAIKSTTSQRWKVLLEFNCRNRLLLSGTPIQNSMAELWALLHFIMPTLFDSHDEFNEWFSKDIESHAENKTGIDEKHLSRLHMILKPFMLRRIKKDVENELSDKIEIMVYCPLTTRQKLLYMALKQKIRIEDLLHYTVGSESGHSVDKNFTSNLMNLVMQFRKVCNHPELFERRDARIPLTVKCEDYVMPVLVFNEGLLERAFPSKIHLLYNRFNIFMSENVHKSMFHSLKPRFKADDLNETEYVATNSCFSFARFVDLAAGEVYGIAHLGIIFYWLNVIDQNKVNNKIYHRRVWWSNNATELRPIQTRYMLRQTCFNPLSPCNLLRFSPLRPLVFTGMVANTSTVYTHTEHSYHSMQETMEHRIIRSRKAYNGGAVKHHVAVSQQVDVIMDMAEFDMLGDKLLSTKSSHKVTSPVILPIDEIQMVPEFPHHPRPPRVMLCQPTDMPAFLYATSPRVQTVTRAIHCPNRAAQWAKVRHEQCDGMTGMTMVRRGGLEPDSEGGFEAARPRTGWSNIIVPDKQMLVSDAGKLSVLDALLTRLKAQGHRVLIYSQMTKMIDLLEEYMWHRKHKYMRLDGSSKISARRDMVADFQTRADIFVFLLSTRAGGLGINLTAADTVIFYDSDWNPTVDQQAMDRAHRLGQTKQVTVYRLICKGSIEERILQRAREKSEIQRMVISGGNFKPDTLKPKEVVSLLLDDEEIELKYRQKNEERRSQEEYRADFIREKDRERKRKQLMLAGKASDVKRSRSEDTPLPLLVTTPSSSSLASTEQADWLNVDSAPVSPAHSEVSSVQLEETSNEGMVVDVDSPRTGSPVLFSTYGLAKPRRRHHPRGTKRGRPRGSRRGGGTGSQGRTPEPSITSGNVSPPLEGSSPPLDHLSPLTSSSSGSRPMNTLRRGPGRPRLKPTGPANQGARSVNRPRKAPGPLLVPLGSGHNTPTGQSPARDNTRPFGFYQPSSPGDEKSQTESAQY